jgi:hypothetical protein
MAATMMLSRKFNNDAWKQPTMMPPRTCLVAHNSCINCSQLFLYLRFLSSAIFYIEYFEQCEAFPSIKEDNCKF